MGHWRATAVTAFRCLANWPEQVEPVQANAASNPTTENFLSLWHAQAGDRPLTLSGGN